MLGDCDPGGFLAAVLQREEPEVREPRDVAVGCMNAEDAAHAYRTSPIWTKPLEPRLAICAADVARIAAPQAGSGGRSTSAVQPLQRAASARACSSPP